MKEKLWKRVVAGSLALLIVSTNVPMQPICDLFGWSAIVAEGDELPFVPDGNNSYSDEEITYHADTHTLVLAGEVDYNTLRSYTENDTDFQDADPGSVKIVVSSNGAVLDPNSFYYGFYYSSDCIGSVDLEGAVLKDEANSMYQMFDGLNELTSVNLGTTLDLSQITNTDNMFYNCSSLKEVTIPEGLTTLGYGMFSQSGITEFHIPESVTKISEEAFYETENLDDLYCYPDPGQLTWGFEDDFKPDGTTRIHVEKKYLKGFQEKFENFNAVFVGDIGYDDEVTTYHADTHTLVLAGELNDSSL